MTGPEKQRASDWLTADGGRGLCNFAHLARLPFERWEASYKHIQSYPSSPHVQGRGQNFLNFLLAHH